ncbi:MAG: MFS transporter, partial [Stackebrandtia sp.]
MSVTMVVIAKIFEGESDGGRRGGNMGGLVGGLGMGVGPVVGGLFGDAGNWRWIFWINIPLGVAILVVSMLVLRLRHNRVAHSIDFLGAGLAATFTTGALLTTEWGGVQFPWTSPVVLGIGAASLVALGLFLWRQSTAAEPILPLTLFRIPTVRLSFAIQALTGIAMMGTMVYLMIYLQVARGIKATEAGMFIIPMAVGLFVIGSLTGKLMDRGWSTRSFVICGTGFATAALGLLALTGSDTSLWIIRGEMFLFGIGMGQLLGLLIVATQQAAPRHQIGVATTGVRLFQTLGSAFGAALLGTLLNRSFAAAQPGISTSDIPGLGESGRNAAIESFVSSIDLVFAAGAVFMG